MMEPQSYVGEKPVDKLYLEVYPGEGSWEHYLDNGEDFAYREGRYHQYHFEVQEDGTVSGKLVHGGYEEPYGEVLVQRAGEKEWTKIMVC